MTEGHTNTVVPVRTERAPGLEDHCIDDKSESNSLYKKRNVYFR